MSLVAAMPATSYIEKMIREGKASQLLRDRLLYSHDISFLPSFIARRINSVPDVVVQPETIEDVIDLMRYASRARDAWSRSRVLWRR